jgi:hypothetical protein
MTVASVQSISTIKHEDFILHVDNILARPSTHLIASKVPQLLSGRAQATSQVRDLGTRCVVNTTIERSSKLHFLLRPLWMSFPKTRL